MKYLIESFKYKTLIDAENPKDAFKIFFEQINADNTLVDSLGNIAMLKHNNDEGSTIPFRIIPALYYKKIVTLEVAIANISLVLEVNENEAEKILVKCVKEDRWVWDDKE